MTSEFAKELAWARGVCDAECLDDWERLRRFIDAASQAYGHGFTARERYHAPKSNLVVPTSAKARAAHYAKRGLAVNLDELGL